MATPYQNIAKAALMNWNGLSEEEADNKIKTESVEQLEGQVYALDSVRNAVIGISQQLKLSQSEMKDFLNAVIYGPENSTIFTIVAEKSKNMTENQQLGVLSTIHDGWVISNSSEKKFNKKVDRQQLRQYAPLELIGWNEVKSDLLFLNPILASIGVNVNEETLSQTYHNEVLNYMEQMNINSPDELTELLKQGKNYYFALSDDLDARLVPLSEDVSSQVVANWEAKDPETFKIFKSRQVPSTGAKK